MFADDANLFFKHKELGVLYTTNNIELAKIFQRFKLNKLFLNIKKTNYIVFRNKNSPRISTNLVLEIDDIVIDKVKKKFLGVIINSSLSCHDLTNSVQ